MSLDFTRATAPVAVTTIVGVVAAGLAAVGLTTTVTGVAGALALLACGVLAALALPDRVRDLATMTTAVLVAPLAALLVSGFLLTVIGIHMTGPSVAVVIAVCTAGLGVTSFRRGQTSTLPPSSGEARSAARSFGLAGAVGVAALLVAATAVSLVSNENFEARDSFVAMSILPTRGDETTSSSATLTVTNHGVESSRYTVIVYDGAGVDSTPRFLNLNVAQDSNETVPLQVSPTGVRIELVPASDPARVLREVRYTPFRSDG